MPYPKSQVRTNLYTRGNEFSLNGEPYIGPYHRFSSNRVFSGESPNNTISELLTPTTLSQQTEQPPEIITSEWVIEDSSYNIFTTSSLAGLPPKMESPEPTDDQITRGSFMRHFVKSINSNTYYEVSQDSYSQIVNREARINFALYVPIRINWILTGDRDMVYNQNINTVRLMSQRENLPGFELFFKQDFVRYFVD